MQESLVQLQGIAYREQKRAPMQCVNSAWITCAKGVGNDFRGSPSKRQVTILSADSWRQAELQLGRQLPWHTRRANLLISGMTFDRDHIGKLVTIGRATLEITKECDPCFRMDQAQAGLQALLKAPFMGGVCCRVLNDGLVAIGDQVKIIDVESWGFTTT